MATWYVEDIEQIVDDLTAVGVQFLRYDELQHDSRGITGRAGGGTHRMATRPGRQPSCHRDRRLS